MLHKVERAFSGGGLTRIRGEAVNPDAWRNGRRLVDQRFISAGAIGTEPIACGCGRLWVETIAEHDCRKPEAVMLETETETEGEARRGPGRPRKVVSDAV